MSEFQKEELSLEETNKLRISLGLKPLVADDAPPSASTSSQAQDAPATKLDGDALAARNFQDKQDRERRERQDAELKERLARAQAKRDAARRLKGPTLGDPDVISDPSGSTSTPGSSSKDTLKWLKQTKKRAQEHAARRAKELEEAETLALAEYRDSDLAGLRVGHDADDFGEGEERILTLRDAGVLDEGGDELMDAALDQAERDAKNLERKKGAKQYTGLDDEEALTGRKRGVLAKYDADLPEGGLTSAEDTGFRLGASISVADRQAKLRQEAEQAAKLANKQLLSLDYAKNQEVSDYLQEGDVGFKKPKTKKRKKVARVKISFDDEDGEPQQTTGAASSTTVSNAHDPTDVEMEETKVDPKPPRRQQTDNFIDDDELQASLAKSRRLKAKKTFNKMTPEMIARNLAAQRAAEEAERSTASVTNGTASPVFLNGAAAVSGGAENEGGEGGLTFDETSEFVRAIRERPLESETRVRARSVKRESSPTALENSVQVKREASTDLGDVPMHELDGTTVKVEEDDDVDATLASTGVKEELEEGETLDSLKTEDDVETPKVDDSEPMIGRGMAGTLSFLRQQGMLPQVNPELKSREEQQRQYDAWLAARRREEQERELARQASKASGSSVDQATREAQNRNRELEEARLAQDRFRDYNPDVEIKYHDEFGRDLDQKEAWKHLSHVFHGKKPGTKKMEKRLKKIEDEKKRERMAAGDTPTGMLSAFQSRSERTGKAHMVLSVGSRGSAPQENDLLDGKGASSSGMQLKKAAKSAAAGAQSGKARKTDGEMLLSPLPTSGFDSSGAATVSANGEDTATTATPKTGGGWARIGSATPAPAASGTASTTAATGSGGFKPVASGTTSATPGSATSGGATPPTTNGPFRLAFSGLKRKAEGL